MNKFDFTIFIGRFQPFHSGHLYIVQEGLRRADKLILLIGSAWQPRNTRNPWSYEERETMVRACLTDDENQRLLCLPLIDVPYNDEIWVRNVQSSVNGLVAERHEKGQPASIALIGHKKDHSGFYLNLFPQWENIGLDNYKSISATPLREVYFSDAYENALEKWQQDQILPVAMVSWLRNFAKENSGHKQICEEIGFVKKYKQAWSSAPYAPTFVTVDAVVVQSGHVLLVERGASPGKGLWALPGGFVEQDERLQDACFRELREETKLKVPVPVLKGSIKKQGVYDDPFRSARGRTITHAFYIELAPHAELPKVKGSDDAKTAKWIPLSEINSQTMFEDHYFIIEDLLGAV